MTSKKGDEHFLYLGCEMAHNFIIGKIAWSGLQVVADDLAEDAKSLQIFVVGSASATIHRASKIGKSQSSATLKYRIVQHIVECFNLKQTNQS